MSAAVTPPVPVESVALVAFGALLREYGRRHDSEPGAHALAESAWAYARAFDHVRRREAAPSSPPPIADVFSVVARLAQLDPVAAGPGLHELIADARRIVAFVDGVEKGGAA